MIEKYAHDCNQRILKLIIVRELTQPKKNYIINIMIHNKAVIPMTGI